MVKSYIQVQRRHSSESVRPNDVLAMELGSTSGGGLKVIINNNRIFFFVLLLLLEVALLSFAMWLFTSQVKTSE